MTRLEVWGDPIAHSLSPRLHSAAYVALGLDWSYGRRRVDEASFARELAAVDASYRGLSITAPLKGLAFAAAVRTDRDADLTGAVNTLLFTDDGPVGFNTDVDGLVVDLRGRGIAEVGSARIVGAGATATSALVALGELGAREVEVFARRPEAAAPLVDVGRRTGISVTLRPLDATTDAAASVPVTISTLPGEAAVPADLAPRLVEGGGLLYDVVYGHWPTALARVWEAAGAEAVNGLGMLLHQAVGQVRVFTAGDAREPLEDEEAVVAVMRAALVGD